MKTLIDDINKIKQFGKDMKGVFTLPDLRNIFPSNKINIFYRRIKALEREKILKRFVRKIYTTENFDLKMISHKINPASYISFETVLSETLIIGTIPINEIKSVKLGKKREYISEQGRIIHLSISKHLYFGFRKQEGINIATKEKAFLDTLYFYVKGMKYYFDIYSDMDIKKLNKNLIEEYLKKYKNPKFITFIRSYLNDYPFS